MIVKEFIQLFQHNRTTLCEKVSPQQLEQYGETFCRIINRMHADGEMFWQVGDIYEAAGSIIYQFIFGATKENNHFEINTKLDPNSTRIYGNQDGYDYLILVKPSETLHWLNIVAVADADKTIWDYYEAGY